MLWFVVLIACKKSAGPTAFTPAPSEPPVPVEPVDLVGSGPWAGAGLSLYVPPDWTGREGPPPRILGLTQQGRGTRFDIYADATRDLGGCDFRSEALYRAIPALGLSSSATCLEDGRIRQVWWATVDGRVLHIEATYPEGEAVRARLAVGPLLEGLKRE